jgi:hypothetical protein
VFHPAAPDEADALRARDVREQLREWEAGQQAGLRELVAMLRVLQEKLGRLRGEGVRRVSLVCRCDGKRTGVVEDGPPVVRLEIWKGAGVEEGAGLLPP